MCEACCVLVLVLIIPMTHIMCISYRWREAGRQTSNLLSLDKAVLQDVQDEINVRDGADHVWESFTPTAYLQVWRWDEQR